MGELESRAPAEFAHRHRLGVNDVNGVIDALAIQADLVEPEVAGVPGLTDTNDLPVLSTLIPAQRGVQVSMLIAGDKALLALS